MEIHILSRMQQKAGLNTVADCKFILKINKIVDNT